MQTLPQRGILVTRFDAGLLVVDWSSHSVHAYVLLGAEGDIAYAERFYVVPHARCTESEGLHDSR